MPSRIRAFLGAHRFAAVVTAIVVAGGSWFLYRGVSGKEADIKYVTAAAEKGTLVSSVSGSGSVSASDRIDLKPKASGDLTYLGVVAGQEVKAGTIVARVDAGDAYQSYKDAQAGLETAELSLEKLKAPADAFDLRQAERAVEEARQAESDARDDMRKGYEDGYNAVVSAFLELPEVMTTLQDALYGNVIDPSQSNVDYYADAANRFDPASYAIRDGVVDAYSAARASYDAAYADYKGTSRFADDADVENLIDGTYETSKMVAESVKKTIDFIRYYKDQLTEREMNVPSKVASQLSGLTTALGQANASASSLLGVRSGLAADRKALKDATWTIEVRQKALADLQAGADALDVRSQELSVAQRRNSVAAAARKLADYAVVAPFDGVMATVDASKGEAVSTGTVLGTLITKQRIAEVTLSEVDVAKVAVGQKATLAFDAVADLTITGQVAEVDALGTSSQGVVNYGVKIAFDTQDERIKPAMSVTATVIIEAKPGVLLVPASAVKTQLGASYVEVLPDGAKTPERREVAVGSANDESVEIVSGLAEGENVVTRTIDAAAKASSAQSSTNVRGLTGGGFGGNAFVVPGGGANFRSR